MERVSIKDIAEKAGVSIAAVSFVLNNKEKKSRISKAVADKIRKTAEELNYIPNKTAQSLRTGKTNTIGLIVADISNPFFAKLARCAENIAEVKGYQVMFGSSDESSTKFQKLVDLFMEKNIDGIIITPPEKSENAIMQLVNANIPCVMVDRNFNDIPVSSVQIDNQNASYSLTQGLIESGCRKIGFVAYNIGLPNIYQRYLGYCDALKNNDIELDKNLVCTIQFKDTDKDITDSVEKLLLNGIDSIVFATNRVGLLTLRCLHSFDSFKSLKYACIDNVDEYGITDLNIQYVEQPIEEISKRALSILFNKIENKDDTIIEKIVLQTKHN